MGCCQAGAVSSELLLSVSVQRQRRFSAAHVFSGAWLPFTCGPALCLQMAVPWGCVCEVCSVARGVAGAETPKTPGRCQAWWHHLGLMLEKAP